MGEVIERSGVPKWAWGIILTAFLALMSFTIGASAGNQKIKDDVETNKYNIEKLDQTKASKEKVDMTYEIVVRMEHKLDDHIAKTDK